MMHAIKNRSPTVSGVSRRRRYLRSWLPDGRWTLVFLAPYLLGFAVFIAIPVAASFGSSFTQWSLFGNPQWNGLDNYHTLVHSTKFWHAVLHTVYYVALLVPGEIILALALAVLVNKRLVGTTLFRSIYFAPFIMSLASIGLIWTWLYSPNYGFIDSGLHLIGLPQLDWLQDQNLAMPALVLTSLWRNTGYYMVIFLAGLQAIPEELYEAARLDGATRWAQFWHVTRPLLSPTTFFAVIVGVILGFQVFDLSYIMTQGGPNSATVTLVFYIYVAAFENGTLGYASAAAFALLLIMLLFTLVYFYFERRWVHYGE